MMTLVEKLRCIRYVVSFYILTPVGEVYHDFTSLNELCCTALPFAIFRLMDGCVLNTFYTIVGEEEELVIIIYFL